MQHILLTGAGFSRNWGGWLADEAFEYLLGCPKVSNELLWRYKGNGGFEAALDEVRTQAAQPGRSVALLNEAADFEAAIRQMFGDMDKAFAENDDLEFMGTWPDRTVKDFLIKFDAIFTLNQDLLLERHYTADSTTARYKPKGWQIAGMVPTTGRADTPIREVSEWTPMTSAFALKKDAQPYFKLHGSVNWIDQSTGKPIIVIGRGKAAAIGDQDVLGWIYQQFNAYLSKPDTRLMVIGYSFGDAHINTVIGEAADRENLRMFIIDPCGVDVLQREGVWLFPDAGYLGGNRMHPHLIGASRRTLREIFGGDPVEHGKVMRFFA